MYNIKTDIIKIVCEEENL